MPEASNARPAPPLIWSGIGQIQVNNGQPFIQGFNYQPVPAFESFTSGGTTVGMCCGTRQVYFGSLGMYGVLTMNVQPGPVEYDSRRYPKPQSYVEFSLEDWIRADCEWWNSSAADAHRPRKYIYIGVIADAQKRAFGDILEANGWVFGAQHVNGNTGRLLHIVSWSANNGDNSR